MGYWLRGYEGERNNCFSKFQLVGQKNIEIVEKNSEWKLDINPFYRQNISNMAALFATSGL